MERIGNLIDTDSSLLLKREGEGFSDTLKTTTPIDGVSAKKNQHKEEKESDENSTSKSLVEEVWSKVSSFIKPEIDEKIYAAWFQSLKVKSIEIIREEELKKAKVTVVVPNKFSRDHIKANYSKIIEDCFYACIGYPTTLFFIVETLPEVVARQERQLSESKKTKPKKSDPSLGLFETLTTPNYIAHKTVQSITTQDSIASQANTSLNKTSQSNPQRRNELQKSNNRLNPSFGSIETNLNTAYNFSNFVIGSCNQFAHAACLKVSESPGTSYNPLLIYGGVGLGKTHLANAVGNAASRRGKKVLHASSETFVSELIASLRTNTMDKFKSKFRSLDILIIDDIQFIIGKERTQEEFFHTFNELYGKKKQIIITSDKLPQDLIGLEERLRTRFASGLSVDLQAPDFETRVAILTKKAELSGLEIPYEVAKVIADRIDTNVRELEGALTRLQALCSLLGESPSLEIAQKVIDTIAPTKKKEVTTDGIKQIVARQFNVSINDLSGKRRTQNIALARQVAMYLCRKHTARSFPEIGALFGGRDHSTVIHAIKAVSERMQSDLSLKTNIETIVSMLDK